MRIPILLIMLCLFCSHLVLGQEEHHMHLASIRASLSKKKTSTGIQGDSAFIEYALEYLLEEPQDIMFVSNRELLTSLCLSECGKDGLIIHDTVKKKKQVDIKVFTSAFDPKEAEILYYPGEDSLIKAIDGRQVYGAVDKMPTQRVDSIFMKVGKRVISIPEEAYDDLYQPNLCEGGYFQRPLSAFSSLNGEYMYIYIYGGESSGTYLAKLIFDKKRYIKKIVAEYEDLIQFGCIRPDFIGF